MAAVLANAPLWPVLNRCHDSAGAGHAARRAQCLRLLDTIADEAPGTAENMMALALLAMLQTPAEAARSRARLRDLAWLQQQSNRLLQPQAADAHDVLGEHVARIAAEGEIAAIRTLLRARGIALTPPADWKSPWVVPPAG